MTACQRESIHRNGYDGTTNILMVGHDDDVEGDDDDDDDDHHKNEHDVSPQERPSLRDLSLFDSDDDDDHHTNEPDVSPQEWPSLKDLGLEDSDDDDDDDDDSAVYLKTVNPNRASLGEFKRVGSLIYVTI